MTAAARENAAIEVRILRRDLEFIVRVLVVTRLEEQFKDVVLPGDAVLFLEQFLEPFDAYTTILSSVAADQIGVARAKVIVQGLEITGSKRVYGGITVNAENPSKTFINWSAADKEAANG